MPRLRLSTCALSLAALATTVAAQDQGALQKLIDTSFASAGEAQVYAFLADAWRLGLLRDGEEMAWAKEFYQAVKCPAGGAIQILRPATHGQGGGGSVGPLGSLDTESSDTVGFANDLNLSSGSCTVTGATGGTDERDVYRFRLAGPGEWLVSATMTGTTSTCHLFDDAGRLVVEGRLAGSVLGVSKICLPPGTYYVNAVGAAYTLTVTAAAAVCPLLVSGPNNGIVNPAGLLAEVFDVSSWKLVVAAPHADVSLRVASLASVPVDHNLFFNLGRANAGRVHLCDNVAPAPAHANDPVMKAGLPAGTYYLYLQNTVAAATLPIPYTITVGQTPITPIPLCGATNYTFTASGNRDLFVFQNTAPGRVTIDTTNGTVPPPAMDSYLELFDARMGLLIFNDDGCAAGMGCAPMFRSYIDATLPPGTYYLTFRGFSANGLATEFGDYLVTGNCGQPPVFNPVDAVRVGPLTLAAGTATTHVYRACCETPLVVNHTNNVTAVGSDGLLRASYQQLQSPGRTSQCGTSIVRGDYLYLVQRTSTGASTAIANLYVAGKLGIELSPVSNTGVYSLRSEEKAGQTEFLFMTVGSLAAGLPVPGYTGLLCLDVIGSPVFFLSSAGFTNAAPRLTWPLPDLRLLIPPASLPGVRFQALSVDGSFTGGFTNHAQ